MAARELVAVVIFRGEIYGPGYINPPPDDVAARITNPGAWGDPKAEPADEPSQGGQTEEPPVVTPPAEPPAPTEPVVTEPEAEEPPTDEPDADTAPVQPVDAPPRSGRGSGVEAWRAFAATPYAQSKGVVVSPDSTRDEIIEACEKAGAI